VPNPNRSLTIEDVPERSRFEAQVDEGVAFLTYRRQSGEMHLLHTEVPDAASGNGVGSRLVRHAAERAREEGLRVVAPCPFASAYLERHPDLADDAAGSAGG
jgi:uncharacterized protein